MSEKCVEEEKSGQTWPTQSLLSVGALEDDGNDCWSLKPRLRKLLQMSQTESVAMPIPAFCCYTSFSWDVSKWSSLDLCPLLSEHHPDFCIQDLSDLAHPLLKMVKE